MIATGRGTVTVMTAADHTDGMTIAVRAGVTGTTIAAVGLTTGSETAWRRSTTTARIAPGTAATLATTDP